MSRKKQTGRMNEDGKICPYEGWETVAVRVRHHADTGFYEYLAMPQFEGKTLTSIFLLPGRYPMVMVRDVVEYEDVRYRVIEITDEGFFIKVFLEKEWRGYHG